MYGNDISSNFYAIGITYLYDICSNKEKMPFPYNNLLIISAKICHNIGYRKINSRTLEILSELIERIIFRLTESAFLYFSAEQAEPYFDLDHLFETFTICKKFEIVNFLQLNHLKRKTFKNDRYLPLQNPLLTSPDIKNQYLKTLTGQNLFSNSAAPIIDNYSLWLSQDPIYTNLSGKMKNRYPIRLLKEREKKKKKTMDRRSTSRTHTHQKKPAGGSDQTSSNHKTGSDPIVTGFRRFTLITLEMLLPAFETCRTPTPLGERVWPRGQEMVRQL